MRLIPSVFLTLVGLCLTLSIGHAEPTLRVETDGASPNFGKLWLTGIEGLQALEIRFAGEASQTVSLRMTPPQGSRVFPLTFQAEQKQSVAAIVFSRTIPSRPQAEILLGDFHASTRGGQSLDILAIAITWDGKQLDLPTVTLGSHENVIPKFRVGPNPARAEVTFEFEMSFPSRVQINVFDIAGRRVRTIADDDLTAGPHEITWNRLNTRGERAPAGVYLVKMSYGAGSLVQRLVLVGN